MPRVERARAVPGVQDATVNLATEAFALGRAVPVVLGSMVAGWLESRRFLANYRRVFQVIGGLTLVVAGRYMLNACFFWIPALAGRREVAGSERDSATPGFARRASVERSQPVVPLRWSAARSQLRLSPEEERHKHRRRA